MVRAWDRAASWRVFPARAENALSISVMSRDGLDVGRKHRDVFPVGPGAVVEAGLEGQSTQTKILNLNMNSKSIIHPEI